MHFWESDHCYYCKEKHPQLGGYEKDREMVAICYECLVKECNK